MRKILLFFFLVVMALGSCTQSREAEAVLDNVETYMSSRPDSALAVLRSMPQKTLRTAPLRARHALLHSQALDKCYIDLRTDSIIAPAVRYYSHHGAPDYRLKACYYRARIAENAGDTDEAMDWLVRGERYVPRCEDFTAAGRLYSVKSAIYNSIYDFTSAIDDIDSAIELYRKDGNVRSEVTAMLDKITLCLVTKDYSSAEILLGRVKDNWDKIDSGRKSRWFDSALTLNRLSHYGDPETIISDCMSEIVDVRDMPLLRLVDSYLGTGDLASADHYLTLYAEFNPTKTGTKEYLQRKYRLCGLQGNHEDELAAYKAYVYDLENSTWEIIQSQAGEVEERALKDIEIENTRNVALFIAFSLLLAVLCAVLLMRSLLQARLDKLKMESDLLTVKEDFESLSAMKDTNLNFSIDVNAEMDKCLSIMEGLIQANITGSPGMRRQYEDQLQLLSNEKGVFSSAIMMHVAIKAPSFISYLNQFDLSEKEISLCCMYATGLSGKQISALLGAASPQGVYNMSSDIRKKLSDIQDRENLGTYLEKRYKNSIFQPTNL